MQLVIVFLLFILGLCVGSFLNVVIYRSLKGESFVMGRSHCDDSKCNKKISWYDNIPLLSYLILGGSCRYCNTRISIQHPVIELMTGVLFVWWYVVGFAFFKLTTLPFSLVQPLFWLMIGVLLWLILVTDLLHMVMPTLALVVLPPLALLYRWWLARSNIMAWEDFWQSIAMGLILSGFLWLLRVMTKGKGMGDGDVIFALSMGILLGWPRGLVGIFAAFLSGAMVGIWVVLFNNVTFSSRIAFGPFLILGTVFGLIWGEAIWNWYLAWLW